MAMQLAYYRTHGRLTATYESSTTRGYLNGRTETVRQPEVEKRGVTADCLVAWWCMSVSVQRAGVAQTHSCSC